MRRALLRLSCLLAAAAAVRDAEDDMDRQLQMFASRYMFATDGQISEGLDREMNDLSLGFRKQRQSARRGGRRRGRASGGGSDDIENYMLNAIDVGEQQAPAQRQAQQAAADPDDQWRVAVPRDEMFDPPQIPAGNPRRLRGRPSSANGATRFLDEGFASEGAGGRRPRRQPSRSRRPRARRAQEVEEDEEEIYDDRDDNDEYYDDEEEEGEYYYDEEEGEYYYDDEYEEEEPPPPPRGHARGGRRQSSRPHNARWGAAHAPASRRADAPPEVDGAIEALDVGLDPAAEQALGRARGLMRQAHAARAPPPRDDEASATGARQQRPSSFAPPPSRRRRGRRLSASAAREGSGGAQHLERRPPMPQQLPPQQLPPPPLLQQRQQQAPPQQAPWGFGDEVVEGGAAAALGFGHGWLLRGGPSPTRGGPSFPPPSPGARLASAPHPLHTQARPPDALAKPPVDIWGATTARNCNQVQFDYTEGVDACNMCQTVAESWYRAETVCHCYKSRNHGNEYFDKCKDMLVSIRQRRLAPTPQPPRVPLSHAYALCYADEADESAGRSQGGGGGEQLVRHVPQLRGVRVHQHMPRLMRTMLATTGHK